ncbi:hypothetical protein SAMN05443550_101653 [Pedobacter hartonius]|uniref:DNA-directed RNA polymerase specialized sigma subunit, sigma24 family n=2 Tax=Pedobacter hartonius TaxID=425514 RepID=A0A1H3XN87_9SPHI|nr:hypothetical protein SAMN05443550_101653 [Pedobacter hartonius]
MLKTDTQAIVENKPESVRNLYDRYAGMLLGYIFEIVKDSKLAEQYLVHIFCKLSEEFKDKKWEGPVNWCQLQRFAQRKMAALPGLSARPAEPRISGAGMNGPKDKYIEQLSSTQQQIFIDIYYYRKTTAALSVELNKTEEFIRKTLKEAFVMLRKSDEN